jgi:hypothetical protein
MKKVTRFSPKLEWMRPYLELGMSYVSEGAFVERVGAWRSLGKGRGKNCYAALYQDRIGDPYRIWIHLWFDEDRLHSKMDLLKLLAHEISHIEDWEHTPRHEEICSEITIAFMRKLKSEGYVSEEAEMKENK